MASQRKKRARAEGDGEPNRRKGETPGVLRRSGDDEQQYTACLSPFSLTEISTGTMFPMPDLSFSLNAGGGSLIGVVSLLDLVIQASFNPFASLSFLTYCKHGPFNLGFLCSHVIQAPTFQTLILHCHSKNQYYQQLKRLRERRCRCRRREKGTRIARRL